MSEMIFSTLRRLPGAPLHHQVLVVLRDAIAAGKYPPGAALPGEEELARQFAVSRVTIRSAIAALQQASLVERRHGAGTFVREAAVHKQIRAPMREWLAHIREVGRGTQVKLIGIEEVTAPEPIRALFETDAEARFQRVVRVRSIARRPIFHVVTYVPLSIAERFARADLRAHSMLELFSREGVELRSGEQVVSAALAEPKVAGLLGLQVGEALLNIRRLHRDQHGQPVEYLDMLASPANFELRMTLEADDL